jgi:uncharacterized repeat protein (TIGR03833 family)
VDGTQRTNVKIGANVSVVLKEHQRCGTLTKGIVEKRLTNSSSHPHGIKVRLEDGQIGRVKVIHD